LKVIVFALDSVPPEMLFGPLLDKMPNVKRIYDRGVHGELETCHPPITIPAWMVMMTGKNPGRLGIYGFRHRRGFSYDEGYIVSSKNVREPCVWDVIGERGLKSCVIGLPPSYPPKPINGNMVSCLVTPGADREYTWPPELKQEIEGLFGKYVFDVTFRTEDRAAVKKELFDMTEKRFAVAKHLAEHKEWDLFILHEIGFDRLHHAFWKYFDPAHPKYVPGNQFERIAEEYYRLVDQKIGELMEVVGKDDVHVLVLSDHGSKAMKGAFCVNEWLAKEGYLRLEKEPNGVVDLDDAAVDWSRTKAWGWGGYYARIFFNVKGRESRGVIDEQDLPALKEELKARLQRIRDPAGRLMDNRVFEPEEVYGKAIGDKPDLMVYFDGLDWRSAGTLGHGSMYLSENDTGPDDSVHSMKGVFVYDGPTRHRRGEAHGLRSIDVGPTILRLLQVPVPQEMEGKAIDLG
jgi:predicted AlkP superfamily phosphohydrolase/phosphomutase